MNDRWGLVASVAVAGAVVWGTASLLPSGAAPPIHGATNPAVTQATIDDTICVPGYTRTIRPSYRWSSAYKYALVKQQGGSVRDYELDHLIPLELGGAPRAAQNLWLEPWADAHDSDPVENDLHRQVCRGEISLVWAQHQILDFKERNG